MELKLHEIPEMAMPNPVATFDTTMGSFKAEVFLDKMPITASRGTIAWVHCRRGAAALCP